MSFRADVLIASDEDGNFLVAADRHTAGRFLEPRELRSERQRDPGERRFLAADGIADDVYVFTPANPEEVPLGLWLPLPDVNLSYREGRLTISSPVEGFVLELSLEGPRTDSAAADPLFGLYRGIGIAHHYFGRFEGSLEQALLSLGHDPSSSVFPQAGECQSGGEGSSSCSVDCGETGGCSVTCQSGYYACCNCAGGCHCYRANPQ